MSLSCCQGPLIASVIALLCLHAPQAAAQASGNETNAETIGYIIDYNGSHPNNQDCLHAPSGCGSGPRQSQSWYSLASGESSQGTNSGMAQATTPAPPARGYGQANLDSYWWDTFTVTSATLAAGTPVTVSVQVDLTASLTIPVGFSSPYTRAQASVNYGGHDGPAIAFAGTQDGASLSSTGSLTAAVGSSFVLFGDMFLTTQTLIDVPSDLGLVNGSARYTLSVLGADASIASASGHNYTAAVPEPQAWALMLSGLIGVTEFARRRRRAFI